MHALNAGEELPLHAATLPTPAPLATPPTDEIRMQAFADVASELLVWNGNRCSLT